MSSSFSNQNQKVLTFESVGILTVEMQILILAFFVTFAFTAAQECGKLEKGNVDDKNTDLPWLVQLRERTSNDVVCTGSLISNQHVLFGKIVNGKN